MDIKLRFHDSVLESMRMPVTGRKTQYFEGTKTSYRLIDRIIKGKAQLHQQRIKGVLLRNYARDYMRVKW